VLSAKASSASISILADFSFDAPKTKSYVNLLSSFSLTNKKSLLILPDSNPNVVLSCRNIQRSKVTTVGQINTYELLNADTLLISEGALEKIENLFK
jgi:large subunit ribosomal protein L4